MLMLPLKIIINYHELCSWFRLSIGWGVLGQKSLANGNWKQSGTGGRRVHLTNTLRRVKFDDGLFQSMGDSRPAPAKGSREYANSVLWDRIVATLMRGHTLFIQHSIISKICTVSPHRHRSTDIFFWLYWGNVLLKRYIIILALSGRLRTNLEIYIHVGRFIQPFEHFGIHSSIMTPGLRKSDLRETRIVHTTNFPVETHKK